MDLIENSGSGGGGGSGAMGVELRNRKECNKFTYSHVTRPISHIVLVFNFKISLSIWFKFKFLKVFKKSGFYSLVRMAIPNDFKLCRAVQPLRRSD